MQKSPIEEIKELKARLEGMAEHAKAGALAKANEAISVLRELGIDNDGILKELGLKGPAKDQGSRVSRPPKDEPCPVCNFKTDPPHNGRSHRGQAKKRPFTAEELEEKGLTRSSLTPGAGLSFRSVLGERIEAPFEPCARSFTANKSAQDV
jgi:hypothetical protein